MLLHDHLFPLFLNPEENKVVYFNFAEPKLVVLDKGYDLGRACFLSHFNPEVNYIA